MARGQRRRLRRGMLKLGLVTDESDLLNESTIKVQDETAATVPAASAVSAQSVATTMPEAAVAVGSYSSPSAEVRVSHGRHGRKEKQAGQKRRTTHHHPAPVAPPNATAAARRAEEAHRQRVGGLAANQSTHSSNRLAKQQHALGRARPSPAQARVKNRGAAPGLNTRREAVPGRNGGSSSLAGKCAACTIHHTYSVCILQGGVSISWPSACKWHAYFAASAVKDQGHVKDLSQWF